MNQTNIWICVKKVKASITNTIHSGSLELAGTFYGRIGGEALTSNLRFHSALLLRLFRLLKRLFASWSTFLQRDITTRLSKELAANKKAEFY